MDPWFRANIAAIDLNNLPDLDTLHCPEGGPIADAERLIADAWGGWARASSWCKGPPAGTSR